MVGFVLSTTAVAEGTPPPSSSSPPPPNPLSPLFSISPPPFLPYPLALLPSAAPLSSPTFGPSSFEPSSPPPPQEPTTKTRRSARPREKMMKPRCLLLQMPPLPGLIDDGALVEKAGLDGGLPTGEFEMDDIGWWKNFVVKLQMLFTFPWEHIKKGSVLSMKLRGQVELYWIGRSSFANPLLFVNLALLFC